MTWVKKISSDWNPQEHRGIIVGDVVDFPGPIGKLLDDGFVTLCDADGVEKSTYETTGKVTERELSEFRAWIEMKKQEGIKKDLEKKIGDTKKALEDAKAVKEEKQPAPVLTEEELKAKEEKRKAFLTRMAAGRAAKKAAKEAKA